MSDINMGHIDFGIFIVFVLLSISYLHDVYDS